MLTAGHWPSSIPVQSLLPPIPPKEKKCTTHKLSNPVSQGQGWSCELDGCLISTCCSAHADQRVEAGVRHLSLHVSEFTVQQVSAKGWREGEGEEAVVCHLSEVQTAQHNVFMIGLAAGFLIRRDTACARQLKWFAGFAGFRLSTDAGHAGQFAAKVAGNSKCGGSQGDLGN